MAIPVLPLTLVTSLERRLVTSVAEARSPFTGTSQIQDWGASWWEYQIEMAVTQGAKARRLSAFFTALGGLRGRFLFSDPSIEVPVAVGNPYVTEAQVAGASTLKTAGWGVGGVRSRGGVSLHTRRTYRSDGNDPLDCRRSGERGQRREVIEQF
jgi:hypothetical protein